MVKEDIGSAMPAEASVAVARKDADAVVQCDVGVPKSATEDSVVIRLSSLPPDVLWHIARRAGPRSRQVSRALLDAYGALDCSMKVPGTAAEAAKGLKQLLLSSRVMRLRAITSLELADHTRCYEASMDELLTLIAQRMTSLTSLKIRALLRDNSLPLLLPLAPTLTRLDINMGEAHVPPAAIQGLQQLSNLRSLTVRGAYPDDQAEQAWLQVLGCMQQLVALRWYHQYPKPWGPQWVLDLAPKVPQLTSLSLGCVPSEGWDERTTAALQQHLTSLQTLSLALKSPLSLVNGPASSAAAMLSALSQCSSSIQAIHLQLDLQEEHPPADLSLLPSVQLASLTANLCGAASAAHLESVLEALQVQSQLTQLVMEVGSRACNPVFSDSLPTSLVELVLFGELDASCVLPYLRRLPALRRLVLKQKHFSGATWTPSDTDHLASLTQLTALSIADAGQCQPGLHRSIACLTRLQELQLYMAMFLSGSAAATLRATDVDMLQLGALQGLTHLQLGGAGYAASESSLVATLQQLSSLQHLRLLAFSRVAPPEGDWELLAKHLLAHLSRLTSLALSDSFVSGSLARLLCLNAESHGCRCNMY